MSADNYFLIRRDGTRFVVSMGFASDEHAPEVEPHDRRFDTLEEALAYGQGEYSEYGVRVDFESVGKVPCLVDTLRADVARLTEENRSLRFDDEAMSKLLSKAEGAAIAIHDAIYPAQSTYRWVSGEPVVVLEDTLVAAVRTLVDERDAARAEASAHQAAFARLMRAYDELADRAHDALTMHEDRIAGDPPTEPEDFQDEASAVAGLRAMLRVKPADATPHAGGEATRG